MMGRVTFKRSVRAVALAHGFRSGLEEAVGEDLRGRGVAYRFEEVKIEYTHPAKKSKYTPDFVLPNGVIVETKGRFVTADRQKHMLVKAQNPHLDIRFVFSNSRQRISKTSKTTYADWCVKHGFQFADKVVPATWTKI